MSAPSMRATARSAWRELLWTGRRRELAEEYPGAVPGTPRFLGLIHESRSAVGRVHLGVVFLHELTGDPGPPGAELTGLRWLRPHEYGSAAWSPERFELWSRLALRLLHPPVQELAFAHRLS